MAKDWRPRLSVDIDGETKKKLDELIPHGALKPTINALLNDLVEMLERDSQMILGAIMARDIELEDILRVDTEPLPDDPPEGIRYRKGYIVQVVKQLYEKKESYGGSITADDYCEAIHRWFDEGTMPEDE